MTDAAALARALALPPAYLEIVEGAWRPLARRIADAHRVAGRPVLIGINGAQGSGKSTAAAFLAEVLLPELGLRAAILSLDDLYLGRTERAALAREVYPLLATRGVPGTHDVDLGARLLDALLHGSGEVRLPRFDKGLDDRLPPSDWHAVALPVDVVLFEGWCVGAEPQAEAELVRPINRLEAEEDADGSWRRHVNESLANSYRRLFDPIDFLVMLRPPGFEAVVANRALQERKLAGRATGDQRPMSAAELERFMLHYERLTRHMFATMPARADILFDIGEDRSVRLIR